MTRLLAFTLLACLGGTAAAQKPAKPSLAGVLPFPGPSSMAPAPTPTTSLVSSPAWDGSSYHSGCATCGSGQPAGGSALGRMCEWLSFRRCPPVHTMCVPEPCRAPLRTYFRYSECGVGCANAYDCPNAGCRGNGSCGRGGRGCGSGDVFIPPPGRMCASARSGGTPVWGNGSCGACGGGTLGRVVGWFGGSGACGDGRASCAGLGGCTACQYSKVPMSDMAIYNGMVTSQSAGRVGGLGAVGAAPSGHYADPYRAKTTELQYTNTGTPGSGQPGTPEGTTPGATLEPAQPMPQSRGTNPFPGPQGTLPYKKPFTNP